MSKKQDRVDTARLTAADSTRALLIVSLAEEATGVEGGPESVDLKGEEIAGAEPERKAAPTARGSDVVAGFIGLASGGPDGPPLSCWETAA